MYQIAAAVVLLLTIVISVYLKIDGLNDDIIKLNADKVTLNQTIEKRDNKINEHKLAVALREAELAKLNAEVSLQNKAISDIKLDREKMAKDLALAKKVKIPASVTKVDYNKATCEEGLELNKIISELKYKDL